MNTFTKTVLAAALGVTVLTQPANAQATDTAPGETVLVTVILKHDQTMNITEILDTARENGLYASFPPASATVRDWTVAMGLGQIVTLELPPESVRDLNRALEFGAWGSFETEVYLGYDFTEISQRLHADAYTAQQEQ